MVASKLEQLQYAKYWIRKFTRVAVGLGCWPPSRCSNSTCEWLSELTQLCRTLPTCMIIVHNKVCRLHCGHNYLIDQIHQGIVPPWLRRCSNWRHHCLVLIDFFNSSGMEALPRSFKMSDKVCF